MSRLLFLKPASFITGSLSWVPEPRAQDRFNAIRDYYMPMREAGIEANLKGPYWFGAGDTEGANYPIDEKGPESYITVNGALYRVTAPLKAYSLAARANSQRFEVRDGDLAPADYDHVGGAHNRSELSAERKFTLGQDIHIAYSQRIEQPIDISDFAMLGQIHHGENPADVAGISPPFSSVLLPGSPDFLRISKRSTTDNPVATTTPPSTTLWDGSPDFGNVVHWKFTLNFHPTAGAIHIWRNGVHIVNQPSIGLGWPGDTGPYWKYGIYRLDLPETLAVTYWNMECTTDDLSDRILNPLPV